METCEDFFFPARIPLVAAFSEENKLSGGIWSATVTTAGTQACSGEGMGCWSRCGERTDHTCKDFTGLCSLVNTGERNNPPSAALLGQPWLRRGPSAAGRG